MFTSSRDKSCFCSLRIKVSSQVQTGCEDNASFESFLGKFKFAFQMLVANQLGTFDKLADEFIEASKSPNDRTFINILSLIAQFFEGAPLTPG